MRCRAWAATAALLGGMALFTTTSFGADHAEAPLTQIDRAADLADVYAWTDAGNLTVVLTVAGLTSPTAGQAGVYDADVLYQVHVDRDGDSQSDHDIQIRFGQNDAGDWGVQADNLPGSTGTVDGAVETVLDASGVRLYAGLRDDPFFFDLDGFSSTLQTGTLMFDNSRDSVAGRNATAIVLELDEADVFAGANMIHLWATTGRK